MVLPPQHNVSMERMPVGMGRKGSRARTSATLRIIDYAPACNSDGLAPNSVPYNSICAGRCDGAVRDEADSSMGQVMSQRQWVLAVESGGQVIIGRL